MRIGLHLSISKGLTQVVTEAVELSCEAVQIFAGNPRGWAKKPLDQAAVAAFKEEVKTAGLGPIVVHLSYLPNPAAPPGELAEKSLQSLAEEYRRAVELGADFLVVHPGKAGDQSLDAAISQAAKGIRLVLDEVPGDTLLLLENQAGAGSEIAGRIKELGVLLKAIGQPKRTGVCFDTCHAHAAGYDLRSRQGLRQLLAEIDTEVGFEHLRLLHLNDTIGERGSHLDRHAHIGQGKIGAEGFRLFLAEPRINRLPGILETPRTSADDDRANLAAIRRLLPGGEQ
jgi:deoxyribonuclease-4